MFVAGFTATNKLYGLLEIAAVSMGFAVSTYAGQNLGAGEHERIKSGVRKGAAMAAVISVVISMGTVSYTHLAAMKTPAKDMTKGHPGRLLLQFALPLMLGNIFQQTYTMVDTADVSQMVGVHALAALGSVDWFNWMSLGICSGLSQGFSIMIAQQFGAKEYEKMKKTVGVSLILAVLSAIVVTVVFLLSAAPVLRLSLIHI